MNLFENAKFGDKFRTRDGRMAIYNYHSIRGWHDIIIEGKGRSYHFADHCNGIIRLPQNPDPDIDYCHPIDIVGKWEERDKGIIDKACDWLKRELADPMPEELYQQWCEEKLADFRKAMTELDK